MAFVECYGIGANDLANAFGTSVGAKALKYWQAVVVASIFEFLGSILLGANNTETMKAGVANVNAFKARPEIFMWVQRSAAQRQRALLPALLRGLPCRPAAAAGARLLASGPCGCAARPGLSPPSPPAARPLPTGLPRLPSPCCPARPCCAALRCAGTACCA